VPKILRIAADTVAVCGFRLVMSLAARHIASPVGCLRLSDRAPETCSSLTISAAMAFSPADPFHQLTKPLKFLSYRMSRMHAFTYLLGNL